MSGYLCPLLGSAIVLLSTVPIPLATSNPSRPPKTVEPGWSVWRPKSEIRAANFSSGFSNMELGGFLDFEQACSQALGTPPEAVPYWFRLSDTVQRIGTGKVEYGCWQSGRWVGRMTNTAVSTKVGDVTCLRVRVPSEESLHIRAQPGLTAKIVGSLSNGATVKPNSFPALMTEADGRDWVAIVSPKQGWVSNDRPTSPGNLTLCR